MTDFQLVAFDDNVGVTTGTTWTAPLGTGHTVDPDPGDALFVVAYGRFHTSAVNFGIDTGWTPIGAIGRTDVGGTGRRYHAMQVWWKIADGTETSVGLSVDHSGFFSERQWWAGAFHYRDADAPSVAVILNDADDTTGSGTVTGTYQAPDFTVARTATIIHVPGFGAFTYATATGGSTSNGFTNQRNMSGVSIGGVGIWDQLVDPGGTYDLPAVPVGGSGTSVAMSKTIALPAELPLTGKYVGRVVKA